jgi:hypothetical protein
MHTTRSARLHARQQSALRRALRRNEALFQQHERLCETLELCEANVVRGRTVIARLTGEGAGDAGTGDVFTGDVVTGDVFTGGGWHRRTDSAGSAASDSPSLRAAIDECRRSHHGLAWARLFLWLSLRNVLKTRAKLRALEARMAGLAEAVEGAVEAERREHKGDLEDGEHGHKSLLACFRRLGRGKALAA